MNKHFDSTFASQPSPPFAALDKEAGGSEAKKGPHKVGVHLRVVPSGAVTLDKSGKTFMRAAVLISPGPIDGSQCAEADIANWPGAIEALLTGVSPDRDAALDGHPKTNLSVLVRSFPATFAACTAITDNDIARSAPAYRTIQLFDKDAARTDKNLRDRQNDVALATTLWQRLLHKDPNDWEALARLVAPDAGAAKPGMLRLLKESDGLKTPQVIGAARHQLGLALPLEQARSLKERLEQAESLSGWPREENLAHETIKPNCGKAWPSYLGKRPAVCATPAAKEDAKADNRQEKLWQEARDLAEKICRYSAILRTVKEPLEIEAAYKSLRESRAAASKVAASLPATELTGFSEVLRDELERHALSTGWKPPSPPDKPFPPDEPVKPQLPPLSSPELRQRFAAIQAQPQLGRLFNLVVDVLIPWESVSDRVPAPSDAPEAPRYALVTATLGKAGLPARGTHRIWVATKFSSADAPLKDAWPCTRDEAMLRRLDPKAVLTDGSIDQIDGFLAVGAGSDKGGWRYELMTLDVERAGEQRLANEVARHLDQTQTEDPQTQTEDPRKPVPRRLETLRTAGFRIADRHRAIEVTRRIVDAAARFETPSSCIIGAEDLTEGYRLDVGLPHQPGIPARWFPLCSRRVVLGEPDPHDPFSTQKIGDALRRLEPDVMRRAALQAAVISPMTRVEASEADPQQAIAYVEDQIACWLGAPLGAETEYHVEDTPPKSTRPDEPPCWDVAKLEDAGALKLSQTFYLTPPAGWPAGETWLSPRCEIGGRYVFQMRTVLRGGVCRDLNEAARVSEPNHGIKELPEPREALVLPHRGERVGTTGRIFRRHERIEAPTIATPLEYLRRTFDSIADGTRETGNHAIIRSSRRSEKGKPLPDGETRAIEDRSIRIFLPPGVSAEFADVHGVFPRDAKIVEYQRKYIGKDKETKQDTTKTQTWVGPLDALRDVNIGHDAGGFPVLPSGGADKPDLMTIPKPNGDAVFGLADRQTRRAAPFYPDPAARFMVFALRDIDGALVGEPPIVVPLRQKGESFLQCRPVAVEFLPAGAKGSELRRLTLAGQRSGGAMSQEFHFTKDDVVQSAPAAGAIRVSLVQVRLRPGESFWLDVWCCADSEDLARHFEVVANLAFLNTRAVKACEPGGDKADALDASVCSPTYSPPSPKAVAEAAAACVALLERMPVPELASKASLLLTHGVERPTRKPVLRAELMRVSEAERTDILEDTFLPGPPRLPLPYPFAPGTSIEPGANTFVLSGTLDLDRRTTGSLQIMAKGANLSREKLDDTERRRNRWEVARGRWPRRLSEFDLERQESPPHAVETIYGFNVDHLGRVRLPEEAAVILQLTEPSYSPSRKSRHGCNPEHGLAQEDQRPLLSLQQLAHKGSKKADPLLPRVAYPTLLSGTQARLIDLEVVSTSPSQNLFRDMVSGSVIEGEAAEEISARVRRLPLPASVAPAAVSALEAKLSFRFGRAESDVRDRRGLKRDNRFEVRVSRELRVRIPLRRPWFTSGIGERLGIILWPPEFRLDAIDNHGKEVDRGYESCLLDCLIGEGLPLKLSGTTGTNLPPEWAYISRWGRDPIRDGSVVPGWILPRCAFPELSRIPWHNAHPSTPGPRWEPLAAIAAPSDDPDNIDGASELFRHAVYVGRAQVPFPKPETSEDGQAAPPSSTPARSHFSASLLTYHPRFDIDSETWYCDIALDPSTTVEPFVRLGLVRYQPLAPEALQVSEPIVEWIQVPPARTVTVSSRPTHPKVIDVIVEGPVALPSNLGRNTYSEAEIWRLCQTPLMRISLRRRHDDGKEEIVALGARQDNIPDDGDKAWRDYSLDPRFNAFADLQFIPETQKALNDYLDLAGGGSSRKVPPSLRRPLPWRALEGDRQPGGLTQWKARFHLAESPEERPGSHLVVVVEEIEAMRPASYAEEPFDESDCDRLEEREIRLSGPRFAARVDFRKAETGKSGEK